MKKIILLFLFSVSAFGVEFSKLKESFRDVRLIAGHTQDEDLMICCHGYGGDAAIADAVASEKWIPHHLIGFNFPDFGPDIQKKARHEVHLGSPKEVLPLLKLLHAAACDCKLKTIHLYGYSAGGGAVVNTLAILTKNRFPDVLGEAGIGESERISILAALQKGSIFLDCPLKSMDEVMDLRGPSEDLAFICGQYARHQMRPIDRLEELKDHQFNIFVHFQKPDAVLSNRDDVLYIERLKDANSKGQTHVILGEEGRHAPCLPSLINAYKRETS